jgi:ATP-dependent DNA helicase RecG
MKNWTKIAIEYLNKSLIPIPQELNELDWKEFLSANTEKLSKHISAFANHAGGGYIVFGIEDLTAQIKGVDKEFVNQAVDKLSSICRNNLEPVVTIDHAIEIYNEKPLLFIYIKESPIKPVFLKQYNIECSYIRSGGTTRQASRHEIGALMLNSKLPVFEELNASTLKKPEQVIALLDFTTIHKLLKKPVSDNQEEILYWLAQEKMIMPIDSNGFYITNFGALAAARNLLEFDGLARKSIRLVKYEGTNKAVNSKEFPGTKGYAIGFEGLIDFIKGLLPGSEVIKSALREETSIYPEIALRELIANALIHQDFTMRGSGPMIEIFTDRIEITNPGRLLPNKKIDRLIRTTPESRNEVLAAAFRRYGICEERGSGFEKTIRAIELFGLPPLKIEEIENSFRVTIYSPRSFANMTDSERIEAAYQHSIIQYFSPEGGMSNASLRDRFKMHDKQASQISRLIKDALDKGRIKQKDPESDSKKFTKYVPYWA